MGGKGSGPQKGGGGGGLPKNKRKVTIDQAAAALKVKGYELGTPKFDLATKETFYPLHKDGKVTRVSAGDIKKMIY